MPSDGHPMVNSVTLGGAAFIGDLCVGSKPEARGLTVVEVEARVQAIRDIARDDERAHADEDALHAFVLDAIAKGECADPAGCAAAALKTDAIVFARWCA